MPTFLPPHTGAEWPKIVGLSSIIMAAAGMLMNVMPLLQYRGMKAGTGIYQASVLSDADLQSRFETVTLLSGIGAILLGLPLMAGGIFLLQRRPAAGWLFRLWAGARILLVLLTAPVLIQASAAMMQNKGLWGAVPAGKSAPPIPPAQMEQMQQVLAQMTKGSIYAGWCMILIGPALALYWFSRPSVRKEMAKWLPAETLPPPGDGPGAAGMRGR